MFTQQVLIKCLLCAKHGDIKMKETDMALTVGFDGQWGRWRPAKESRGCAGRVPRKLHLQ